MRSGTAKLSLNSSATLRKHGAVRARSRGQYPSGALSMNRSSTKRQIPDVGDDYRPSLVEIYTLTLTLILNFPA